MAPWVVFDTSVLFSAVGWGGRPFECLAAARSGDVRSVTCSAILEELREKLVEKRGMTQNDADEIVSEIASFSELMFPITARPGLVPDDPDDDVVIACALDRGAELIVTGDRHLLALRK